MTSVWELFFAILIDILARLAVVQAIVRIVGRTPTRKRENETFGYERDAQPKFTSNICSQRRCKRNTELSAFEIYCRIAFPRHGCHTENFLHE